MFSQSTDLHSQSPYTSLDPKSQSRTSTPRATPPTSSSSRLNTTPDGQTNSPHTPLTIRRLPTASPPSARLRRLAPTPVKIPPTPPLPPSLKNAGGTYRHWTAGPGGSPVKKKVVDGHGQAVGLPMGSGLLGQWSEGKVGHDQGLGEEEEEEEEDDEDPFDLDIQFAAPLPSSPIGCIPTYDLPTQPLAIPARPIPHRQSSSATDRTNSTLPSFSTSPVYHSKNKSGSSSTIAPGPPPFYPGSNTLIDRSSLPALSGRSRTRSSRTIPDVPDEVLDTDELSSDHSRSRQSTLWSGSDEDARPPTRRTGDELLSPGAFLAAHVPRPVLVQFRDVFGGNDTVSPHLPAGVWASPAGSPVTVIAVSPSSRGGAGAWGTGTEGQGRQGAGFGMGIGDSPTRIRSLEPPPSPKSPNTHRMGASPGGMSIAESFATFGVHRMDDEEDTGEVNETPKRTREESGNSDVASFTFSAYLADDDPLRETVAGRKYSAGDIGVGGAELEKGQSSGPIPRSKLPLHQPKAPEFRTHTHLRSTPVPTPTSAQFSLPHTLRPTLSNYLSADTPELIEGQYGQSPASSDEWDELVTPEQRDQALHGSANSPGGEGEDDGESGQSSDDFGTPTPRSRDGYTIGLGLTLCDTSYRQPGSDHPYPYPTSDTTDLFSPNIPKHPIAPSFKVPKMMRDDYRIALESQSALGLSGDDGGHPLPIPLSPSRIKDDSSTPTPPKSGPKKFKSLASLRKRLPSSRGDLQLAPPIPTIPLVPITQSDDIHPPIEYASLTGKPAPSRPGTATRHLPTSQTGPSPIGDSIFDRKGETPPATATSLAFSINSTGTGTTGSSAGRATAASVAGVKKAGSEVDDGWKGGLKADLNLDGVVVPVGMTLNLWVDQENCREVISTLHAIRFHPPSRTRTRALDRIDSILLDTPTFDDLDDVMDDSHDEGNVFWEEGCVEFGMNPRKRAKWEFTYGALEAFPSLRRVTMDGKQNYDFTSRIASLKHRHRGIYAVFGEEKNGAKWRFRYMVDAPSSHDPRARIIVPLSFYVNPAFIRGSHASKLGFTHMLGKAIRPNLHSEKISTPEVYSSETTLVSAAQPSSGSIFTLDQNAQRARSSTTGTIAPSSTVTVSVRVETEIERDTTPRQRPVRQYRPGTADARMGGMDGRQMGEMSPLLPKTKPGRMGSAPAQVSAVRSPRPSTAQEPRQHTLSSMANHASLDSGPSPTLTHPHQRYRPGTASGALPSIAQADKSRVAPFITAELPTPPIQPLNPIPAPPAPSRIATTFRRSRALTSGARPSTPLSAPLPPVPETERPLPPPPASTTRSTFANGVMRAKKSLSNLRPPSRPGTAGSPLSKPLEGPPLPTSSSAGLLGLGMDKSTSGRLRTKSGNAALGMGLGRPSTAGNAPTVFGQGKGGGGNGSQSASIFSSFAPFSSKSSSRPSTANPTSQYPLPPHTPQHQPPTAPHIRPLQFGFGSHVDTPINGFTYSDLALQQLEQHKTPGMIGREFYGNDVAGLAGGKSGLGLDDRRPRTATGDGRRGELRRMI